MWSAVGEAALSETIDSSHPRNFKQKTAYEIMPSLVGSEMCIRDRPLTVICFSKIQIGFTFLVPAHLGSPGKRAVKRVFLFLFIIMWRLTLHVSVIKMMNRRRGGHVDLRVAVSLIKRFEFLFESVCSDVQVASDDVR